MKVIDRYIAQKDSHTGRSKCPTTPTLEEPAVTRLMAMTCLNSASTAAGGGPGGWGGA